MSSAASPADDDIRNGSRACARDGMAVRLAANGAAPTAFEQAEGGSGSWRIRRGPERLTR